MGNDMCGGERGEKKKEKVKSSQIRSLLDDVRKVNHSNSENPISSSSSNIPSPSSPTIPFSHEPEWFTTTTAYLTTHTEQAGDLALDRMDDGAIQEYHKVIARVDQTLDLHASKMSIANKKTLCRFKFRAIGNIAAQWEEQVQFKRAAEYYEQAFNIASDPMFKSDASSMRFLAVLSTNIANVYFHYQKPIKSMEYYEKSAKFYKELAESNPPDIKMLEEKLKLCERMQGVCSDHLPKV